MQGWGIDEWASLVAIAGSVVTGLALFLNM